MLIAWTFSMADAIPRSLPAAMIRKFHALAEQRCAYFVELHRSGRWRHYHTADELAVLMSEAMALAERWRRMLEIADAAELTPAVPQVAFARAS